MAGRTLVCTTCRASIRGAFRIQPKRLPFTTTPNLAAPKGRQRLTRINGPSEPQKLEDLESLEPTDLEGPKGKGTIRRLAGINGLYEPKKFEELEPTDLATYWDTVPPNKDNIAYADQIFKSSRHSPVKLFSAAKFRTIPFDSKEPEVAFIGRSNVGKSSIINALTDSDICYTSKRPGKTTEMNAFGIGGTKGGESKIVLLDMPGYGKASHREWGVEIMKYLQGRRQ